LIDRGSATAQAISHRLATRSDRVRSYKIRGGTTGSGAGFSEYSLLFSLSILIRLHIQAMILVSRLYSLDTDSVVK
jgi:hypothetical protein